MRSDRSGFTLVEMLVVIGIIGILIVALVPVVKNAQDKAKEAATSAGCSQIEAALAAYAQSNNGNYPGVAVDVMAPWKDHALGDPALLAAGTPVSHFDARPNVLVAGVIGDQGYYGVATAPAMQLLKSVKDQPLGAVANPTPRYFDALLQSGSIQEYPVNAFVAKGIGGRPNRMRNTYRFMFDLNSYDPTAPFAPGDGDPVGAGYVVGKLSAGWDDWQGGAAEQYETTVITPGYRFAFRSQPVWFLYGLTPSTFNETEFSMMCGFGTGTSGPGLAHNDVLRSDGFAPGDFAYVPVLSSSVYPVGNSMATIEDESFKWGTQVTGYMLFGYGSRNSRNKKFADEQTEFAKTGLPGMGAAGVDTIYEAVVVECFEGAIYFSKKI